MSSAEVTNAVSALRSAFDTLAEADLDTLTHPELLDVLADLETLTWRTPTIGHRIIARLSAEASPTELGAKSLREVLTYRLRISTKEATRRISEAADLGPRTALTGEPLAPVLAQTAAAQTAGTIGPEHVDVIRTFYAKLPHWVDVTTREQTETTLCRVAAGLGPEELGKAAARLAALIDQDGPPPDDKERARRRSLTISPQGPDGMSRITGWLTPEAAATLEAVNAKLAAPGMANPDDQKPVVDGEPNDDAARTDLRTPAQRRHDALLAMGRSVLSSGELGQHNGLPATIIVSTTLAELESGAGHAVTGGGTLLPMPDLIRMASHAHHYLAIFDDHTGAALHLGRTRRCASPAQRIVLHAKDRGCTFPGCTVPGYGCQAHHAVTDWADDGHTNIDDLTLACGPHNRLVHEDGWTTRKRQDGRTEWIPPPHLNTARTHTTNDYHHPERMLFDPDDDEP